MTTLLQLITNTQSEGVTIEQVSTPKEALIKITKHFYENYNEEAFSEITDDSKPYLLNYPKNSTLVDIYNELLVNHDTGQLSFEPRDICIDYAFLEYFPDEDKVHANLLDGSASFDQVLFKSQIQVDSPNTIRLPDFVKEYINDAKERHIPIYEALQQQNITDHDVQVYLYANPSILTAQLYQTMINYWISPQSQVGSNSSLILPVQVANELETFNTLTPAEIFNYIKSDTTPQLFEYIYTNDTEEIDIQHQYNIIHAITYGYQVDNTATYWKKKSVYQSPLDPPLYITWLPDKEGLTSEPVYTNNIALLTPQELEAHIGKDLMIQYEPTTSIIPRRIYDGISN